MGGAASALRVYDPKKTNARSARCATRTTPISFVYQRCPAPYILTTKAIKNPFTILFMYVYKCTIIVIVNNLSFQKLNNQT